jgi:hypothetical protein
MQLANSPGKETFAGQEFTSRIDGPPVKFGHESDLTDQAAKRISDEAVRPIAIPELPSSFDILKWCLARET